MLPSWWRCFPDHHRSTDAVGPAALVAVGVDQGAVQDDVAVPGRLGGQQRPVQQRPVQRRPVQRRPVQRRPVRRRPVRRRLESGGHGDRFVAVVVGRGGGDGVVAARLRHAGVVEEPAQHRLIVGRESPAALTRASTEPLGVEQARDERDTVLGHGQDRGVGGTHSARNSS